MEDPCLVGFQVDGSDGADVVLGERVGVLLDLGFD